MLFFHPFNKTPEPVADSANKTIARSDAHVLFTPNAIYFAVEEEAGGRVTSSIRIDTDGSPRSVSARFFEYPELALPYADTTIYIDYGGSYCVVPESFLRQGIPPTAWPDDISADSQVMESLIADQDYGVIYSAPKAIHEFCERSFSLQTYQHPITALLSAAAAYSRQSNPRTLIALVDTPTMDLVYFQDDRLMLANRYSIQDEVDALYFISAAWRHFELIGAQDRLALFGRAPALPERVRALLSESVSQVSVNDYAPFGAKRAALPDLPPLLQFSLLCV